jgi:threonine/homoserine/homoserine lactone efflux protein
MFGIQNYGSFVVAIVVFQLIPGPGTITILGSTARGGIRAGMGAVAGTLTSDLLFMFGAVLGLAAVLAARPALLSSLQWAGIAYLCWVGVKLLLFSSAEEIGSNGEESLRSHFRKAFSIGLTNPKAIMFFMAFFPLFLKAGTRPWILVLMMAHVSVISALYQAGLVLVGNAAAVKLGHIRQVRVVARRLAGAALIGFGVKLAASRR